MNKKVLVYLGILVIVAAAIIVSAKFFIHKPTNQAIAAIFAKKYNRTVNPTQVSVTADTGSFAKGTFNEPAVGGGVWFAVKKDSGWELAYDGNGIIPCNVANQYNLPKDIAPQCIDTQNNNNLITR